MIAPMYPVEKTAFKAIVDELARKLIATEYIQRSAMVRTPVLYPSGATVVIEIREDGDGFFVSDMGLGYQEADLMGAGLMYGRHARAVAQGAGIGFDHHSFFVIRASRDQLPGAVATVANCSQQAVSLVAYKLAERRSADEADLLYERLVQVFSVKVVDRQAEIVGASNIKWHVATFVRGGDGRRPTIFEPVTNHHTSVVNASAKFNDIARLEKAPARVIVVRGKSEFGQYLSLLSQAANVIDRDMPDTTLTRLVRAA